VGIRERCNRGWIKFHNKKIHNLCCFLAASTIKYPREDMKKALEKGSTAQKKKRFDNFNGRDILADLGVGVIVFDGREIGCEHVK
jgi:hypothetical protein